VKPGDLVRYRNTPRIPQPLLGIIISEKPGISIDQQFFNVLLQNGVVKIISNHYLEMVGANLSEDEVD
jgi:hypothetical protein